MSPWMKPSGTYPTHLLLKTKLLGHQVQCVQNQRAMEVAAKVFQSPVKSFQLRIDKKELYHTNQTAAPNLDRN